MEMKQNSLYSLHLTNWKVWGEAKYRSGEATVGRQTKQIVASKGKAMKAKCTSGECEKEE